MIDGRNALWRGDSTGILPRRTSRSVCRTLYHGKRLHRLCSDPRLHAQHRRSMAGENGMQSGTAGQQRHHRMGGFRIVPDSPRVLDSLQGIINTFTEHHGGPWSHKDMQHTMMVCRYLPDEAWHRLTTGCALVGRWYAWYLSLSQGQEVFRSSCHVSHPLMATTYVSLTPVLS